MDPNPELATPTVENYVEKCKELTEQLEDAQIKLRLAEQEVDVLRRDIAKNFANFLRIRAENGDLREEIAKLKAEVSKVKGG